MLSGRDEKSPASGDGGGGGDDADDDDDAPLFVEEEELNRANAANPGNGVVAL